VVPEVRRCGVVPEVPRCEVVPEVICQKCKGC
jgi:hypothetical protein